MGNLHARVARTILSLLENKNALKGGSILMVSHFRQDQRYWSIYNQKTLPMYQSKTFEPSAGLWLKFSCWHVRNIVARQLLGIQHGSSSFHWGVGVNILFWSWPFNLLFKQIFSICVWSIWARQPITHDWPREEIESSTFGGWRKSNAGSTHCAAEIKSRSIIDNGTVERAPMRLNFP